MRVGAGRVGGCSARRIETHTLGFGKRFDKLSTLLNPQCSAFPHPQPFSLREKGV
ncbi:MAG: hypothetical protein Kow0088_23520 [Anaerolineales bacterium]